MTTTAAPKAGTPATKTPAATKTATTKSAAVKTVQPGTKAPQPVAAPKPPVSGYELPHINPNTVVRIFENIPEYRQYKIANLDMLIKGMQYLATAPIKGIGPGGVAVNSTPFDNFLATLMQMAVEKGTKGVVRNS